MKDRRGTVRHFETCDVERGACHARRLFHPPKGAAIHPTLRPDELATRQMVETCEP
jgi:hypothetical protein